MSRSKRGSRDEVKKKSNHTMPPEPVNMTRSGVNLINDLLDSPTREQEREEQKAVFLEEAERGRRGAGYHGTLRRDGEGSESRSVERMRSGSPGDRLSEGRMSRQDQDSQGRVSRSSVSREGMLSHDRMTQDRLNPNQDRMNYERMSNERMSHNSISRAPSFHDSQLHFGSAADDSRSLPHRLSTARMTVEEQALYEERDFLADPFGRRTGVNQQRLSHDLEVGIWSYGTCVRCSYVHNSCGPG